MLINRRFHFPSCNTFLAYVNAIVQEVFPHWFLHTSGHSGGHTKYSCYINFLWQKNNYFSLLLCPSFKKKKKSTKTIIFPFVLFILGFIHVSGTNTKWTDENKELKIQGRMDTGANLGPKGWSIAPTKTSWVSVASLNHNLQHEDDNINSGDLDKIYLWGSTDVILLMQTDLLVLMVNLIHDTYFIPLGGPDNHLV